MATFDAMTPREQIAARGILHPFFYVNREEINAKLCSLLLLRVVASYDISRETLVQQCRFILGERFTAEHIGKLIDSLIEQKFLLENERNLLPTVATTTLLAALKQELQPACLEATKQDISHYNSFPGLTKRTAAPAVQKPPAQKPDIQKPAEVPPPPPVRIVPPPPIQPVVQTAIQNGTSPAPENGANPVRPRRKTKPREPKPPTPDKPQIDKTDPHWLRPQAMRIYNRFGVIGVLVTFEEALRELGIQIDGKHNLRPTVDTAEKEAILDFLYDEAYPHPLLPAYIALDMIFLLKAVKELRIQFHLEQEFLEELFEKIIANTKPVYARPYVRASAHYTLSALTVISYTFRQ